MDLKFMRVGKKKDGSGSAINHRRFSLKTSHSAGTTTTKKGKKSKKEKRRIRRRNNST